MSRPLLHFSPPMLAVVAAALVDPDRRLLVQQRPLGSSHGGAWELRDLYALDIPPPTAC